MRAIALEYHDIVADPDSDASGFLGASAASYKIRHEDFASHLQVLDKHQGAGINVQQLSANTSRSILFTFDDGGISAIDAIARALEERNYIGHFFVVTSLIGKPGFCDPDHLRELHHRGHVVGSHTHSHPIRMSKLSDAELIYEWKTSNDILEECLGSPRLVASIPGGYYSPRVAHSAGQAGIRFLFTSEPIVRVKEVGGCLVLGRFTLRRSSRASEVSSLVGPLGAARTRQWATWNIKKVVKATIGGSYLKLRAAFFGEARTRRGRDQLL